MGYIVGIILLLLTTLATLWVTWRSDNPGKETYSQAEFKREIVRHELLLVFWLGNVAYWAIAALNGGMK